jgi:glycosyltransferase involved in cell wall biosynthesis
MNKDGVYVVIPAYNEEKRLPGLMPRIKKFLSLSRVIVVDDGSKNEIAGFLPKKILVARHRVNLGKGMALKTGCELAIKLGAKRIVLMDADGQHDPKEIPAFVGELDKGYKVVFGVRERAKCMPRWRVAGNWILSRLVEVMFGLKLHDVWCGYRAFESQIYKKIVWKSADYSADVEMAVNVGKAGLKHRELVVGTIYLDKLSTTGTTINDGIKLLLDLFYWRINTK